MSKDSDMPMRRLVCACIVSAGVTLAFAAPLRGQGLEESDTPAQMEERTPRVAAPPTVAQGALAAGLTPAERQVLSLVRVFHLRSEPYGEYLRLEARTAIPILQRELSDPAQQRFWSNSVAALGAIGDAQAVDALSRFLSGDGRLTADATRAKLAVPIALGYAVNRTRNERALKLLIDGTNADMWRHSAIRWTSPFFKTSEDLHAAMAAMSIMGLGVSGDRQAREFLISLMAGTSEETRRIRKRIADADDMIAQALADCDLVARIGLVKYYETGDDGKAN
jgi:HEAT repeat protein